MGLLRGPGALDRAPDPRSAIEQLRRVHRDRRECAAKGQLAAERAFEFSWERSGELLRDILIEVGMLASPISESRPEPAGEPPLPSLLVQTKNYARAQIKHAVDGRRKATEDLVSARLAACDSCDQLRPSDRRCSHIRCGCFVDEKATWQSESCPLGRWPGESPAGGCGCGG